MKRPILIALIGYIIGIIWELYLKISIAPLLMVILIAYFILKKDIELKMILVLIIAILVSNNIIKIKEIKYKTIYADMNGLKEFVGIVISDANHKEYSTSYTIKIKSINGEKRFKDTKLILNIANSRNIKLQYGDEIDFIGDYKEPEVQRNYKGFDYSEYLKTIEIYGTVNYSKINNVENRKLNKVNLFFHDITNNIEENITKILSENEADLLIGILLGNVTDIDEDIKENFRNSGLYHILAVSGTHVVYIIIGISYIIDKTNISVRGKKILKIAGIICFSLIVNSTVSVMRAALMAIIAIGAELFFRHKDIICSIATSMLIILICNPYNINSTSFQLSYMGVIGIVGLNEPYFKLLVKMKIKEKFAQNMSVILAAQTAIVPIMIINYHTTSLTFLLANLLATHVTGAIIILGFILAVISFFSLNIAKALSVILSILINLLNLIAKICAEIPFSKIFVTTPSLMEITLYYIIIYICSNNKISNKKLIFKILVCTMIFVVMLNNFIIMPNELRVYFIDQTTPNMIQGLKGIFARKPLISRGI